MSRLILVALAVGLASPLAAADAPRFVAEWSDGSHTAANEVTDWHRDDRRPQLDNRPLFDPKLRLRSLIDTQLAPAELTGPVVELIGGDRLPGRVVAFEDGLDSNGTNSDGLDSNDTAAQSGPPQVPHLLVETPLALDLPGIAGRTRIPVLAAAVRRIVGDGGRRTAVQPGNIRLLDGRLQSFLSLRCARAASI